MRKGEGADSNDTAGSLHHGSWGHVAVGEHTFGVVIWLVPVPASCTVGSGAQPIVVAAAGSCVRPGFSSWHGSFVGPNTGPEFCVPLGGTKATGTLSKSMSFCMLMPEFGCT